jgi:hypothetical protein
VLESRKLAPVDVVDRQTLGRHFHQAKWKPFAVVILLEILFALLLLRSPGTTDVTLFMGWIDTILHNGIVAAYSTGGDYPPLGGVILLLVAKIAAFCSIDIFLSFKISLVAALVCGTLCFWGWTLDAALTGLLAVSLYFNGVALGYIDTYLAPTLILSLWALQRKKIALFSALFAVSCLIKWQPLIIAPFLVLHAISIPTGDLPSARGLAKRWFHLAAPALVLVLGVVLVFGYSPMVATFSHGLQHPLLSGNALNFNWLVTYFLRLFYPDQYGAITNGIVYLIKIDPSVGWANAIKIVFVLFYLGALWRLIKMRASFAGAIECSLVGYLSYFIFNIGVHENHLFLATILAAVGAGLAPDKRLRAVLIVGMSNLNLIAFYGFTGSPLTFSPVVGVDASIIFSTVNVLLFLFFWSEVVLRRVGPAMAPEASPRP